MFSHSDHHHQNALGGRPTLTTATAGGLNPTTITDQLLAHHRHLESLLDSALATLTLITLTNTTTTLSYTSHVLQVVQALTYHIAFDSDHTPTPPTVPSNHLDNAPTAIAPTATYAAVTVPHGAQSSSLTTPDRKTTERRPSPSPPSRPAPNDTHPAVPQITRVVIRFDLEPNHSPTRADPLELYSAIARALSPSEETMFGGVQWTQRGNLVVKPARHLTAEFLLSQKAKIWKAIHPLLGLPAAYSRPPFELDNPWHSVVFHGVPTPPDRKPDTFTLEAVEAWLDPGDVKGPVKAFSVLCRPEDFGTKTSVAVRVSLSSEADAQRLVENGGCFHGAQCRVTHYSRKSRSVTP
ncbi:hypothetical protein B0H11DRAFT_1935391 [Mycena galericulata]|nr:hypothetical protein B0H11DRAFT_1935391 [Mycena galericulata]